MLRYQDVAALLRVIENSSCEELVFDNPDYKIVLRRPSAAPITAPAEPVARTIVNGRAR